MNRKALIKISLFSLVITLLLSLGSLLFLNRFASIQGSRFRDDFLTFYASSLERRIQNLTLEQIRESKDILQKEGDFPPTPHFRSPPPDFRPGERPHGPPPRGFMPPPPQPRTDMWIVFTNGLILNNSPEANWDLNWTELPKPKEVNRLVTQEDFLRLQSSVSVIKLNYPQDIYLVVRETKRAFLGPLFLTQAILTATMIIIALAIALAFMFFYLHRKSQEARSVLRRLEQGDLKARFEIRRFDEFGELMLDFNRMAEEIETLVGRIHSTEKKRKELLQELGHDLRTPLTGLKTNFETLQVHHERLSAKDKTEMFTSLSGEITYLQDLIEKLMAIASLDEPHYKASTEEVDLVEILSQEVQMRQSAHGNNLTWTLQNNLHTNRPAKVLGDGHLLLRLLRNGLDNASRYANSTVKVNVTVESQSVRIYISDDGPGLEQNAIESFGKRREFQGRRITKNGHFSLGLGAVIMSAIAQLHNGAIGILNVYEGAERKGAMLVIELPLAP
ncbi:MAG TPA: HAMP domain-containing sensor histidine kinase [Bdellovibrio sp.]